MDTSAVNKSAFVQQGLNVRLFVVQVLHSKLYRNHITCFGHTCNYLHGKELN